MGSWSRVCGSVLMGRIRTSVDRDAVYRHHDAYSVRVQHPQLHLPRCGRLRHVQRGVRGRGHRREQRVRLAVGDGPLPPDPAHGPGPRAHTGALHPAGRPGPLDPHGSAGRAGDRRDLPQPGPAGQDRHHPRHRVGRAGGARHRRGVVRGRARRLRLRVPAGGRAHAPAGGRGADLPGHVRWRTGHRFGQAPPHPRGSEPAPAHHAGRAADTGGRRRRAAHPGHRGPLRRRLQHLR